MKQSFLILFAMFIGMAAFSQNKVDVMGETVGKSRSAEKYVVPTNDVEAPKPDESRSRCCLNFDNYTGYVIHVWVDEVYRGTVGSWGDGGVCVAGGFTTWYARTAGSTYSWSGRGECRSYFNLKLE